MKPTPRRMARWFFVVAAALASFGCTGPDNRPDAGPPEPFPASQTVLVAGFVWDPEALQFGYGNCGPDCGQRPSMRPRQNHFLRSLVGQADVQLLDLDPGGIAYTTASSFDGLWQVDDVARRPTPLLYPLAWQYPPDGGRDGGTDGGASDAGGGGGGGGGRRDGGDGGASFNGPIPATTIYYPTVSASRPISPSLYQCVGRPAAVIGNNGILEALAKHLTETGKPTVTADFVDKAKFGGVIIWWVYAPDVPTTRQGAAGTTLTPSSGQLVYVQWGCPPNQNNCLGEPIAAAGLSTRSARYFYVLPGATSSNVGIAVTLLPAAPMTLTVKFTIADPVVSATSGRPYSFDPLPSVTAVPGKIMFAEAQAIPALLTIPLGHECMPSTASIGLQ